jgi:nitric oxide dioxygenase
MLDQKTRDIVRATAPVLLERGVEVTMHMYALMSASNPKVISMFSRANQTPDGQPLALARALHAYAANIDNLEALTGEIAMIANKHASLGVRPEHYSVVGRHLIQSLKDVLNFSSEQLIAWGVAYRFLAKIFISAEEELYAQARNQDGGWEDYRPFILDKKVEESEVIVSFYLKPKDEGRIASFRPGQYITVRFDFPGGNIVTRNYSLSDSPNGDYYRISIKKERRPAGRIIPDGLVSCYLHDYYQPGMEVQVRAPMGSFVLDPQTSRPIVLLSGGVGLTPMISMINMIARDYPAQEAWFIHGALNGRTHAMRDHIRNLAASHPNIHVYTCYSEPDAEDIRKRSCDKTGFITADWLNNILPQKNCDYYFCGPTIFMQAMNQILREWGVPESQIHYEFFGPGGELEIQENGERKRMAG